MKTKPVILIVDDVPKNIQVLGTLLGKIDCELAVAMNGQQALDTVTKIQPDLILLDVMMPVMDGHETCERLKADPATKDIPVIFLSAKTEPEDIVTGFKLGAVDYVTKPFIGSELIARVNTHLSLRKSQKVLVDEIETKNKFFSIMSHDLRGAFGIIKNFVELIQDNRDYLSVEEINELLDDIDKTSTNTLELLEDLLKWARSQTGAIQFSPEKVSLELLFTSIYESQIDIAKAKNIALSFQVTSSDIVFGDMNMLLVTLRNLTSNAIKFTPKNGKIKIDVTDEDEFLKVSVSDSGVGIAPEQINKLFNISTKVTTEGTNNEQGNGLGLILCKEFVERNGGKIDIESELNKGTTVWFTIPKPTE